MQNLQEILLASRPRIAEPHEIMLQVCDPRALGLQRRQGARYRGTERFLDSMCRRNAKRPLRRESALYPLTNDDVIRRRTIMMKRQIYEQAIHDQRNADL